MSAGESLPSKFQVVWMAPCRNQLLALKEKAMQCDMEIRRSFAEGLRIIQRALEFVPVEWGETITELSYMDLQLCIGFHDGLAVHYGVNMAERSYS
jgi:hypothetical protein